MSHWDGKKIVRWPPHPCWDGDGGHRGWWRIDCGCCMGIEWGGWEPTDCGDCGGSGYLFLHESSGLVTEWPGGKIAAGRWPLDYVAKRLNLWAYPARLLSAGLGDILEMPRE